MTQERIDIVVSEKGSKQVRSNIESIGSGAKNAQSSVQLLNRALGTIGVALSLNTVKNTLDTYRGMQNALTQVTTSQEQLGQVMEEVFAISQRTRSGFKENAEAYRRFALAGRDLGLTQKDVLQFTESLNQAVKLSGASGAEASAGIIQLSQGLASGALRGDELRSVLEQIPAVADVIANSLGVTRGELRKMGEAGTLTSAQVIKAFQEARVELNEKFAKNVPTIADAFTVVGNSIIKYVGELDKAYGISDALIGVLIKLSENMDLIAKAVALATVAWLGYKIAINASIIASVTAAVVGNIVAFVQLASTVRTVTQAVALFNATLLVNPIVLIVTIVFAAIAALILFRKEVYEMMKATNIMGVNVADAFTTLIDIIRGYAFGVQNVFKILLNDLKIEYFKFIDSLAISDDLKNTLLGGVDIDFSLKGKTMGDAFTMGFSKAVENGGSKAMIEGAFAGKDAGTNLLGETIAGGKPGGVPDPAAQKALEESLKRQKKLLEDIKGASLNYKQSVSDLGALLSQGSISADEYSRALDKVNLAVLDTDRSINGGIQRGMLKMKEEFSNLSTLGEQLATDTFGGMEDALVKFATTGKLEIGDLVSSIASDFARLAIRQAITMPLMAAFGFKDGGMIPGFANGGLIQGAGTGRSDSNLARVSAGEYIVNAAATAKFRPILDFINGGNVSAASQAMSTTTNSGGNTSVFAPQISVMVEGGSSNGSNSADPNTVGAAIAEQMMKGLENKFAEWTAKQQRPGGMFNTQGMY